MSIQTKSKPNREYLQDYYLNQIIALFEPEAVWLTGSAADGTMHSGSDFDFIVESPQPLDADAITGALDIIPRRYATPEMMNKAVLLFKKETTHEL
jgi:predicted nucleotidyltransferase